MRRTIKTCIGVAICLGIAALAWPQGGADPLDSLKVCVNTQHLIFDNQFVRGCLTSPSRREWRSRVTGIRME